VYDRKKIRSETAGIAKEPTVGSQPAIVRVLARAGVNANASAAEVKVSLTPRNGPNRVKVLLDPQARLDRSNLFTEQRLTLRCTK
jgi:hypothetical protein